MEQPIYTANYLRGTLIEYDDFIKKKKVKIYYKKIFHEKKKKVIL